MRNSIRSSHKPKWNWTKTAPHDVIAWCEVSYNLSNHRFNLGDARRMGDTEQWARFKKFYLDCKAVGVAVDISRMNFSGEFFDEMEPHIQKAYRAMKELEGGAIANPDENRMVGHYWLRDSSKAPNAEIKKEIDSCLAA